jgi:hypothetical protein
MHFGKFVLHAIQEIEGSCQALVADVRKLADLSKSKGYDSSRRRLGAMATASVRP